MPGQGVARLNFTCRIVSVAAWATLGFFLTLLLFAGAKLAGVSDDAAVAVLPAVGTITGAVLAGAAAWIGTRPWNPDRRRS